jgi:hypothetical protein
MSEEAEHADDTYEFNPEATITSLMERIDEIIEESLNCLNGDDASQTDSEQMSHAGSEISPRGVANAIETELLDFEDWVESHFGNFCERHGLLWDRLRHLRYAPRPGWIADGCRTQLEALEASFRTMRELCLEYGPHCEENSGLMAVARNVVGAIQNPLEGYKAYIGGHKNQLRERDFGYRFKRAGIDIGTAVGELAEEVVIDVRRELKRLYRDVELDNIDCGVAVRSTEEDMIQET